MAALEELIKEMEEKLIVMILQKCRKKEMKKYLKIF